MIAINDSYWFPESRPDLSGSRPAILYKRILCYCYYYYKIIVLYGRRWAIFPQIVAAIVAVVLIVVVIVVIVIMVVVVIAGLLFRRARPESGIDQYHAQVGIHEQKQIIVII